MTAEIRILERPVRDRLGEGPLWSVREQALYWVDILGQRLHRLDWASGGIASWDLPEMIGWAVERQQGGFVVGLRSGFHRLSLDPFSLEPLATPPGHTHEHRFNDGKADAAGRIFAGTMPIAMDSPAGCLWRLDPDGTVTCLDTGYTVANGPAISPDGATLLHTDSVAGRIWRFALAPDGSLSDRRLFRQFAPEEGSPDGMTFDAEGRLWVAQWGAGCVGCYAMDGSRLGRIDLPASQVTSCTFGGPGLDRLFVTSAADGVDEPHGGALFEVVAGTRGLPAHRFAG